MNNKIKVLLVDDETRFCETTSKLLIKKGFDTTIAHSAETAIQILKENRQDVIVLDIKMTGMDGHTALNEIKKIAPETQVIMLTGHGSKYSAMRALVKDAFDYLSKPCDVEILASRIQDAYRAKHNGFKLDTKKALDIMTPIDEFITIRADMTIKEVLEKISAAAETSSLQSGTMEKSPGLMLVSNERNILTGILTQMDVIGAIRPEYVTAGKSSDEESSRFSSIFWSGFFSDRVKIISEKKVREIMSELPSVISENANLLEVAQRIWKDPKRLLLVQDISKTIGIIRGHDIFREIVEIAMTERH